MLSWLSDQLSEQATAAAHAFRRPPLTFNSHRGQHVVREVTVVLAEGGFGFIYRVTDVETGQAFAMKKMICQDAKLLANARREADMLNSLPKHQNIVGYFGRIERPIVGSDSNKEVLILLEYCPNGTLLDFMERHNGKVPQRDILKAFQDVAEAVYLLHSLTPPVAHRDLKCENVILGSDGCWKLVDFGSWTSEKVDLSSASRSILLQIAEDAAQNVTMIYRPPELADVYQRKMISVAVDMWQVGCILYTLMFYRHPFQDAEVLAIPQANYDVPAHGFDSRLEDLMHWLLAPDPADRITSRALVGYLWQWQDVTLPIPPAVEEKKRKLQTKGVRSLSHSPTRADESFAQFPSTASAPSDAPGIDLFASSPQGAHASARAVTTVFPKARNSTHDTEWVAKWD